MAGPTPMMSLERFEGRWTLERQIEDRRAGLEGHLTGTCTWEADGHGLIQHELGQLHYGKAPPMRAERRYLWLQDGDEIAVFFEDGRPFHRFGEGHLSDRHLCDPDTYDVTYEFEQGATFSTNWIVTGPRKDLTIRSRFTPV